MIDDEHADRATGELDLGAYCRQVEAHLTRVNGGHLVRIVGPGFDVVRRWAETGVPMNIVMRGVEQKAERHRHGRSGRPLRIEFCEADVRQVFDEWRRAIGVTAVDVGDEPPGQPGGDPPRKASLTKHLERVLGRLDRATTHLDWPGELRDGLDACRADVAALQAGARGARGEARDRVVSRLQELDRALVELVLRWTPDTLQRDVQRAAEADLSAYRGRLTGDLWQRSVELSTVRLLRDRMGLPTLAFEP